MEGKLYSYHFAKIRDESNVLVSDSPSKIRLLFYSVALWSDIYVART